MDLLNQSSGLQGKSYDEIKKIADKCTLCPLHETRTKVVFGTGPVPCDLMLIGEGPGEQEDLSGLPFVGKAGQLLTKILASAEINREKDIYIANTVKCRPPENRTPTTSEISKCFPYLMEQIRIVQPKILLLCGAPATKTILNNEESISKIRGRWFKIHHFGFEISAMPIFHPSYLLRNQRRDPGSPKWLTWQDMKEIRNALDFLQRIKELEHELK
jgi:DNA polymerase